MAGEKLTLAQVAEHLKPPKEEAETPKQYPFLNAPNDKAILLDFMLDFLLLPPPYQLQGEGGIMYA